MGGFQLVPTYTYNRIFSFFLLHSQSLLFNVHHYMYVRTASYVKFKKKPYLYTNLRLFIYYKKGKFPGMICSWTITYAWHKNVNDHNIFIEFYRNDAQIILILQTCKNTCSLYEPITSKMTCDVNIFKKNVIRNTISTDGLWALK